MWNHIRRGPTCDGEALEATRNRDKRKVRIAKCLRRVNRNLQMEWTHFLHASEEPPAFGCGARFDLPRVEKQQLVRFSPAMVAVKLYANSVGE